MRIDGTCFKHHLATADLRQRRLSCRTRNVRLGESALMEMTVDYSGDLGN
jgi:hypothetical protein